MNSESRNIIGQILAWIFGLILIAIIVVGAIYFKDRFAGPIPSPTSSQSPVFDPRIITIGIDSRPTGMLFYATNHFIPSNRFRIQPIILENPNERWSLMAAGALDMAFSTFPEFVLGAARHKPGKMLMFISSSRGCDGILVDGNINNIEDLVGKRIAVVPGSAGHYFLIKVLDSRKKSSSEVIIATSPTVADVFDNFMKGNIVDAAVLSNPFLNKALETGKKALITTENFSQIEEILCASNFAIENRSDDIQLVVNSYFNLVYLINTNPGLAKSLITKNSGRSVKEVDMLFNSVSFKDLSDSKAISRESIISAVQKMQQIWGIEDLPNANAKIDLDNILEYKYLKNAEVNQSLFENNPPPTDLSSPTPELPSISVSVTPSPEESGSATPGVESNTP